MAEVETVLIVGGGIAGLTLARALHREGFTVELVECGHMALDAFASVGFYLGDWKSVG